MADLEATILHMHLVGQWEPTLNTITVIRLDRPTPFFSSANYYGNTTSDSDFGSGWSVQKSPMGVPGIEGPDGYYDAFFYPNNLTAGLPNPGGQVYAGRGSYILYITPAAGQL